MFNSLEEFQRHTFKFIEGCKNGDRVQENHEIICIEDKTKRHGGNVYYLHSCMKRWEILMENHEEFMNVLQEQNRKFAE